MLQLDFSREMELSKNAPILAARFVRTINA
jgi:hypothetical protein